MKSAAVCEVRTGTPVPFGPKGGQSAIAKQPVHEPVWLSKLGLYGDHQADQVKHGGQDKALHHYCAAHYAHWRRVLPEAASRFQVGLFGENIVAHELDETNVHLGDTFQIGEAIVQVSQPRQPCWKLNIQFDVPGLARLVQTSGLTGWYYRVLQPGLIAVGDTISLVRRPNPQWPLQRVHNTIYLDPFDFDVSSELCAIDELSEAWIALIQNRLKNRSIESWSSRLKDKI